MADRAEFSRLAPYPFRSIQFVIEPLSNLQLFSKHSTALSIPNELDGVLALVGQRQAHTDARAVSNRVRDTQVRAEREAITLLMMSYEFCLRSL